MHITPRIDWVMEKFGESIKKPPSHASMSILLNKQKNKVLLLHNTAMNERVSKGKRSRSNKNEAQVHFYLVLFSHCMLMLMYMTMFFVLTAVFYYCCMRYTVASICVINICSLVLIGSYRWN